MLELFDKDFKTDITKMFKDAIINTFWNAKNHEGFPKAKVEVQIKEQVLVNSLGWH